MSDLLTGTGLAEELEQGKCIQSYMQGYRLNIDIYRSVTVQCTLSNMDNIQRTPDYARYLCFNDNLLFNST